MSTSMSTRIAAGVTAAYVRELSRPAAATSSTARRDAGRHGRAGAARRGHTTRGRGVAPHGARARASAPAPC